MKWQKGDLMKKKISLFLVFQFLFIFLLSGCTSKPTSSIEILFDGTILKFGMTKEDVDNILGESTFVKDFEVTSNEVYYIGEIYQYSDIQIRFSKKEGDIDFLATGFEWITDKVKTFNNINIGTTVESLEKKIKYRSNSDIAYTVNYSISENITMVITPEVPIVVQYLYYYDENGEIYKIDMGSWNYSLE